MYNFLRIYHFSIIFFISIFGKNNLVAANVQDTTDQLRLIAATFENPARVVLRWVPSTPGLWRQCNYYGYKLERAEVDTIRSEPMAWREMSRIRPASLEDWKKIVALNPTDTMLMVAGQAVHGEKNSEPFTLDNMIQKSNQLQNYYSACILAAEFSSLAALTAGLRYEDSSIEKNKTYLYRLTILSLDSVLQNILAVSSVQTNAAEEFPPVQSVEITEGEKLIELLWNRTYYKNYYSAFNIYRSGKEGQSWKKLNKRPVSYLAYKDENKYIYRDSVTQNYIQYQYKIEGITPYATTGPMSEIFTAQGRDRTPPDAPHDVRTQYLGNKKMKITWNVNNNDQDITGFRISKSNEIDKGFVELTGEPLPPNSRSFVDTTCNELINNYYFIGVFDKEGNANVSMPQYGTIIDSVPPSPPQGLEGKIDTNGVVTVKWKLGGEPDLKGYFVHYSNNDRHTFINLTDFHLEDTIWTDTIPLNVLTENIHYKVVAIDHRSNYSAYSDILTLKKPDLVPPASPVFIKSLSVPDGIEIQWYNSSSLDAVSHILYRRTKGAEKFKEIYKTKTYSDKSNFTDKDVISGVSYEYQIVAVDDAGLNSKIIGLLSATAYQIKTLQGLQSFSFTTEKSPPACILSWKYKDNEGIRFVLYRSVNGQPYALYKSISGNFSWKDVSIRKGDIIRYKMKVVNADNWQSDFSKELEVKW
jgi:fibronectin type 3 domain-containing protein